MTSTHSEQIEWPHGIARLGRVRNAEGRVVFAGQRDDGALLSLDDGLRPTGTLSSEGAPRWLAPVAPRKVVCVGRNYRAHAKELGNEVPVEPLLFLKPSSAVIGLGEAIELPPQSQRVEHEGELAVVIARRLSKASPAQVREAILGYTCANDVTARDIQRREQQFTRAKGFDTFCPLGPTLVAGRPSDEAFVTVRVNGAQRQHGRIGDMVHGVDALLSFISHVMTLEPFDVVLTGTPEGVGPLVDGDVIDVEIDGVGLLQNRVRAAG